MLGGALTIASTSSGAAALLGALVGAVGAIVVAAVTPLGDWIKRKDALRSYRRNVYRNFLDHAYWYRDPSIDGEEREDRAMKYVADWHRIQLIAGSEVQKATHGLRDPGSLEPDHEDGLIAAFKREVGFRGVDE